MYYIDETSGEEIGAESTTGGVSTGGITTSGAVSPRTGSELCSNTGDTTLSDGTVSRMPGSGTGSGGEIFSEVSGTSSSIFGSTTAGTSTEDSSSEEFCSHDTITSDIFS